MLDQSEHIRILAIVAVGMQEEIRRQIISFGMIPVLVNGAIELASHIRSEDTYQVVLLPASLPGTEDWWGIWGDIMMLRPRPAVLVYAHSATFQLWSGVLEAGGYDVIVEPLTDQKLKEALLRAAESYDRLLTDNSGQE